MFKPDAMELGKQRTMLPLMISGMTRQSFDGSVGICFMWPSKKMLRGFVRDVYIEGELKEERF